MLTRRELLFAATATIAFRDDALDLVSNALKWRGAPDDEDFWAQVQAAFTLDRNLCDGSLTPDELPKTKALCTLLRTRGAVVSVDVNIRLEAAIDRNAYLDGVRSL